VRSCAPLRLLFAKMPCVAQVELAASTGFDAVIIDTEHGPFGGIELEQHVRAADAAGISTLVRVSSLDPAPILQALDAGVTGVVVPHVLDAAQSRAAVQAAHYPPRGRRGLALSTRAGRYGAASLDEHLCAAEHTLVLVQIEDAEAVAHAREILEVDGVDGVLVGATDLSISLGHPGAPAHPDVSAAIDQICRAARNARVAAAAVVRTAEEAEQWHARVASVAVFVATQPMQDAFTQATVRIAAAAAGDTLLLLPGMLATAELWSDVAESLSEQVPVRAARIDLDDSIAEMADTALAAAPARFALAGHSLGAIVAVAIVQRAPARVSKLALLNVSARAASEQQLSDWEEMRRRTQAGAFEQVVREFALASLPRRRRGDPAMVGRIEAMAGEIGSAGSCVNSPPSAPVPTADPPCATSDVRPW
jgi:4-hydroxy-2-oxoheptanedioate aldolase